MQISINLEQVEREKESRVARSDSVGVEAIFEIVHASFSIALKAHQFDEEAHGVREAGDP